MVLTPHKRALTAAFVVAAVVILGLVLWIFNKRREVLPEVEVTTAAPATIVSTVTADGVLKARNQVDISAEVMAKVKKIYVREGDAVKKGQLLCLLDDGESRAEAELYRSQMEEARASYERGKSLYSANLISTAEYEARRTAYEVARARWLQSRDKLVKTRVYAPLAARVIAVNVEEGETAVVGTMNNAGTVLFTLGDLSAMEAEVYVDETDVVAVTPGQPAVVVLDALPDVPFPATVDAIGYTPATSTTSTSAGEATEFEVILKLKNGDPRLRPGMSVTATITTATRKGVLACPLQAFGREEVGGKPQDTVFVLEKGRARLRPVRMGVTDGTRAEVVSGLRAGEVVITGPYDVLRQLRDGSPVKVARGKPAKRKGKPTKTTSGGIRPGAAVRVFGGKRK